MIGLLFSNPILFLLAAGALLMVITIHEFAHAFIADKLGDPTPRLQGRLTLNPLAHLDPLGTLGIILVGFGWGKPVQFDPYNLKDPKRDTALISLAGPFSNLIFASLLSLMLRSFINMHTPFSSLAIGFLTILIEFNIVLAVFNLLPIHPLDGGKILSALLPREQSREFDRFMYRYGIWVLILLIFPLGGTPLVHIILGPVINFLRQIYIPIGIFSSSLT